MEGRNSKTQIINTTMTFTSLKFKKHFTHSHPFLIPDPCSFAYNSTMIYGFLAPILMKFTLNPNSRFLFFCHTIQPQFMAFPQIKSTFITNIDEKFAAMKNVYKHTFIYCIQHYKNVQIL